MITATRIMYICAVQIVVTTIGFILYKRPYLWAWSALAYYKTNTCGTSLERLRTVFATYVYVLNFYNMIFMQIITVSIQNPKYKTQP